MHSCVVQPVTGARPLLLQSVEDNIESYQAQHHPSTGHWHKVRGIGGGGPGREVGGTGFGLGSGGGR